MCSSDAADTDENDNKDTDLGDIVVNLVTKFHHVKSEDGREAGGLHD